MSISLFAYYFVHKSQWMKKKRPPPFGGGFLDQKYYMSPYLTKIMSIDNATTINVAGAQTFRYLPQVTT